MAVLFFDIQTIPSQDEKIAAAIAESVKPPANYTQAETIARWYREHFQAELDKRYRQTALDGLYGEICSIAWAFDDGEITVFCRDEQSGEPGLLQHFMQELREPNWDGRHLCVDKWVGHFISGFDLRFLWQRCVVNRVRPVLPLPLDARLWDERVFDTQQIWSGGQASGHSKLAALAQGLQLSASTGAGVDGANVYEYWLAGRYQDIAAYNRQSVSWARELYKRFLFLTDS